MSQPPASSPIFARSIPGSKLSDYIRRTVSVTGRVKQVEDGFVLLEACDDMQLVNDVMYLTNHPRLSSLFQPPSSKRVR